MCPRAAGPKPTGCEQPDRDGDTIVDAEDVCPDTPGVRPEQVPSYAQTVASPGCPDEDGDGVTDDKDLCPGQPIAYSGCDPEYLQGCPDDCTLQFGWPGNKGAIEVPAEARGADPPDSPNQ